MSTKRIHFLLLAAVVFCIVCVVWLIINILQIDSNSNVFEELLSPIIHVVFSIVLIIVLLVVKKQNHENTFD